MDDEKMYFNLYIQNFSSFVVNVILKKRKTLYYQKHIILNIFVRSKRIGMLKVIIN